MTQPRVSLVVALSNEAANVADVHARCCAALDALDLDWEILYVDDGSDDGTAELLEAAMRGTARAAGRCRVLRHGVRMGKTRAWRRGFAAAAGRYILTLDADLQEAPEEFRRIVALLDAGWDMIVGWRRTRRDASAKVRASRWFNAVVGFASGCRLHDMNCGLKGMRAELARRLVPHLVSDLHRYVAPLAAAMGYRVTEIEVEHRRRERGTSRYGRERYVRAFADLWLVLPRLRRGRRLLALWFLVGLGLLVLDPRLGGTTLGLEAAYLAAWSWRRHVLEGRADVAR